MIDPEIIKYLINWISNNTHFNGLLFDYDIRDGKELLIKLKSVMSQAGKYPVKTKAGVNYHAMTDMTSKIV